MSNDEIIDLMQSFFDKSNWYEVLACPESRWLYQNKINLSNIVIDQDWYRFVSNHLKNNLVFKKEEFLDLFRVIFNKKLWIFKNDDWTNSHVNLMELFLKNSKHYELIFNYFANK